MSSYDVIKKVVMLGDGGVGKTSLVRRYVVDQFDDMYVITIGAKPTSKDIKYITQHGNVVNLRLIIWDILGQTDYDSVHKGLFSDVDGGLLVFDITREDTMENLSKYWFPQFMKYSKNMPIVLLANKSDLIKENTPLNMSKLKEVADKFSEWSSMTVPYFMTSAKSGDNVEQGFYKLGEILLSKMNF